MTRCSSIAYSFFDVFFGIMCCHKCKLLFYVVGIVPLFCPAIRFFMALFVAIVAIAVELVIFIAIIFVVVSGRSFLFVTVQRPAICTFVTDFSAHTTFAFKLFLETCFERLFFFNYFVISIVIFF